MGEVDAIGLCVIIIIIIIMTATAIENDMIGKEQLI